MDKTTIITSLFMLTAMQQSQAQTAGISIDSCIAYAIKHSTAVEMQRVEARQARADYRWAKADFLPRVGANVSTQIGRAHV